MEPDSEAMRNLQHIAIGAMVMGIFALGLWVATIIAVCSGEKGTESQLKDVSTRLGKIEAAEALRAKRREKRKKRRKKEKKRAERAARERHGRGEGGGDR